MSQANQSESSTTPSAGGGVFKKVVAAVLILLLAVVAYFLAVPSPIDPVAYEPPPQREMSGVLEPNHALDKTEVLAAEEVEGPEDVDVDGQGRIYGGGVDGRIVRVSPDGSVETFANTGGRPLGLDFDAGGNLIVADGTKGLLSIDAEGQITSLVVAVADMPLGFTDDVMVSRDGVIYFSDASSKFGPGEFMDDMLESRPHGRLIRYDPATKKADVLLDDLYFANGVALSADEDFVLVNETWRYRITRYWLKGPRAGESDVFIDRLPGFPDGVSRDDEGTFWLAIFTLRNDTADMLAGRPFLKKMLTKLPAFMLPKPVPYGLVLAIDEEGQIVRSLHGPPGTPYCPITSVEHRDGYLYLGSLTHRGIGRLKLDRSSAAANGEHPQPPRDDRSAEKND